MYIYMFIYYKKLAHMIMTTGKLKIYKGRLVG